MKIGMACDHRGFELKEGLKPKLKGCGYEIVDFGTNSTDSVDYPDYAKELGQAVATKGVDFGVAICGSGIGISIACNKIKGIRCAKVSTVEEAEVTRIDNDSNIIAFGEKTELMEALNMIIAFVETEASTEEKHVRRRNKIKELEEL